MRICFWHPNEGYIIDNNNAYNALMLANGLIMTGPTGTNVNDVAVVLIKPKA